MAVEETGLGAAIDRFRDLQRRFEEAIPSTAVSIDGRTFTYRVGAGKRVAPPGDFVALVQEDARRLGQVVTQELVVRDGPEVGASLAGESLSGDGALDVQAKMQVRVVEGHGVILRGDGAPFVDAAVEPASGEDIEQLAQRRYANGLAVGTVLTSGDAVVPAEIDPAGFNRHTFLCGQSGSGKTYSLGLVLERLLLDTELRMVILDPNSDFVKLREARADADPADAARLAALAPSIHVRRPGADGDDRLRLRFAELDATAHAGVLRLDPIQDADEYDDVLRFVAEGPQSPRIAQLTAIAQGRAEPDPGDALVRRVRNLGVLQWSVWAGEQAGSLLEDLDRGDWRCLVVDIGTLGTPTEKMLVAQAVLVHLWQRRHERKPLLVVIDEAHNVCPQLPEGPLQFIATDTAIRIAAEGRKFGLYLLVSTQRPQKIPENVLSQADNLVLLRLNSLAAAAFSRSSRPAS